MLPAYFCHSNVLFRVRNKIAGMRDPKPHCAFCLVLNNKILLTQGSLLVDGLVNIGLNANRPIYTRQNKSLNTTYMTQV